MISRLIFLCILVWLCVGAPYIPFPTLLAIIRGGYRPSDESNGSPVGLHIMIVHVEILS